MALSSLITTFLFALVLSRVDLSTSHVLKGKISCLDCGSRYDLSGIMVLAKCDKVGKLAVLTAEKDGYFETELPSENSDCVAKLGGGPKQLYVSRKKMVSKIVKGDKDVYGSEAYGIATPLAFYTECRSIASEDEEKCKGGVMSQFRSSKTVNIPLPPEWGLAPSSYYVPFFPIIGIP